MKVNSFYQSTFFRSLAEGLINPFIPVFALTLGATKTVIGLLTTLPTISNLFSQLFFGSLSEILKKKLLVILGGILWAVFWIPIAYVSNPLHLIVLMTLQAILSSMAIPAWTALLIQTIPRFKRGSILGYLNTFAGVGSFIGTLIGGFILNQFGFMPFLFFLIFFLGMISRIPFFSFQELSTTYSYEIKETLKRTFDFSILKEDKKMSTFIKAIMFLNFGVAIAGPFFSVYIIEKLGGTVMDVAIVSIIGIIAAIVFFHSWGVLIDYLGKKTIMLSTLIPISLIPFVYAISPNISWLYVYAAIGQMSWAGFNLAAFSYLSDIVPKEKLAPSVATYNLFTGLSSSIAPFFGGIIADMTGIWFVFILSMAFRFLSFYFFDKLDERLGFKPRNLFKFEFEPFGISYKLETFISTYSLALYEIKRESSKFIDIRKYFRKK